MWPGRARFSGFKDFVLAGQWWHMPLIPVLGRQRQVDLCEFMANLVYRASSRTGSKATEKPCLTKQTNKFTLSVCMCECVHAHTHTPLCTHMSEMPSEVRAGT